MTYSEVQKLLEGQKYPKEIELGKDNSSSITIIKQKQKMAVYLFIRLMQVQRDLNERLTFTIISLKVEHLLSMVYQITQWIYTELFLTQKINFFNIGLICLIQVN